MVRLAVARPRLRFDLGDPPEFDQWRWVDYWHPLREVVAFKRAVYEAALHELEPLVRGASPGLPALQPGCAA